MKRMSLSVICCSRSQKAYEEDNSMHQENGLQDKRVVVLGGSSGIGLATAQLAAAQGAKGVIASRSAERVQHAVESIGKEAQGHTVDLSNEPAVAAFFSKLGS